MRGSLIYNASLSEKKYKEIHLMYRAAARPLGIELDPYPNTAFFLEAGREDFKLHKPGNFPEDFCLFLDKDIDLAQALEAEGIKLFNSSQAIYNCDNKIKTYKILSQKGLPIPKTFFSHMRFNKQFDGKEICDRLEEEFSYPIVIKEAFGSFGEQVYLAADRPALIGYLQDLALKPHLYQEYISSSAGRDLRLQVVNGRVIAAMKRVNETDFRANMNQNARMYPYRPSIEEERLAIEAASSLDCFFCGVDLLFGEDGRPLVCEVNSNAHIKNIFDCTGVDSAGSILSEIKKVLEAGG